MHFKYLRTGRRTCIPVVRNFHGATVSKTDVVVIMAGECLEFGDKWTKSLRVTLAHDVAVNCNHDKNIIFNGRNRNLLL